MSSFKGGAPGEAASARAQLSLEGLLSRPGLIAGAALVLASALSWRWLMTAGMPPMAMGDGMNAMLVEPWSLAYIGPAFIMWAIMMVAMMLPSAAPMILLHARIDRAPSSSQRLAHTLFFALSYLFVWTGFSAAAALGQAVLVDVGLVSAVTLALGDRWVAAAVLGGAALYQFSAAKAACLDQCRSPIHFIMQYWSPRARGTLRLGLVHGLYCLGCCWGLMLLLFVAGVMNLAWVALIAVIVFVEKLAPPAWQVSNLVGLLLLAGAVILLVIG